MCRASIHEMMLRQAPGTVSTYNRSWERGETHRFKSEQRPQEIAFHSERNKMPFSRQPTYGRSAAPGEFAGLPATRIWRAIIVEPVIPAWEPAAGLKLDPSICVITKQLVTASGNSGHQPMLLKASVAG